MRSPVSISTRAVIGLAAASVVLHLLALDTLAYHRDELLYMALGYHPDWGYPSVPPLIGWLAAVIRRVFGTEVWAVKLVPAVLSGVFVLLADGIVRELGGRAYARVLLATALVVMPATLRAFHLFQPVHLDLLWWTGLSVLALRYLRTGRRSSLLWMGAVVGLGLLTKYLIALYVVGILLGLSLLRPATFREPYLYYGGLLALLIVLPNLIWQVAHDLPVVGHMAALRANQLVNVGRGGFLADQLLMAGAAGVLLMPGAVSLMKKGGVPAVAVGFVLIALLILRGKSYYTLGIFPLVLAYGAVWWEEVIPRKNFRGGLIAAIVVVSLPLLPLGLPIVGEERLIAYFDWLEGYGVDAGRRWEDGNVYPLPQDYADQLGWSELGREVAAAFAEEDDPAAVAIYAENYGQAAAILLSAPAGLPAPVSFSDAFNYWVPRRFDPPVEVLYYINDEKGADVAAEFERVEVVGRIDHPYARERGTTIYRFSRPRRPFAEFWQRVLERDIPPF